MDPTDHPDPRLVHPPYFNSTCDLLLSTSMSLWGLEWSSERRTRDSVVYRSPEIFVHLGTFSDYAPPYELVVAVSTPKHWPDVIALGDLLPSERLEYGFSDELELSSRLAHLRDSVLSVHDEWRSPSQINLAIDLRRKRWEATEGNERMERAKGKAIEAFRAQDYAMALKLYEELSPVDLDATDWKRIEIARKRRTQ